MALAFTADPLHSGAPLTYWRITQTHLDHLAGALTVWLHGWRDEASRRAAHAPGAPLALQLTSGDIDFHAASTADIYGALKAKAADTPLPAARDTLPALLGHASHAVLAGAMDC